MKKLLVLILAVIVTFPAFFSCKDDAVDVPFSKNSIEENKVQIEEEGLALLDKMDAMKNLSAMNTLMDLNALMYGAPEEEYYGVAGMVKKVVEQKSGRSLIKKIESKTTVTDPYYTFIGIEAGIYTWNSSISEFEWTASANELTFKYPSAGSTTNNTILKVSNLKYDELTYDSETTYMMTSLNVLMTVSGSEQLSLEMRAEFDDDGMPISYRSEFEVKEGYSFTETFTNSGSKAKFDAVYGFDGEDLFMAHMESSGDFTYDSMYSLENPENEDQLDEFLDKANMWIQAGNLKFAAVVDFNNYIKQKSSKFPDDIVGTSMEDSEAMAKIMNDNIKATLMFAKEKKAIAKGLFYSYEYDEYYYPGEYATGLKFVFADDSSLDQSFMETGFEELLSAYEEFMMAMQDSYYQLM